MKKLFTLFLAILCLLTMLSIPALAADAGIEPYGTPGSGYDQKQFTFNGRQYTATLYLQFDNSYVARSKCETLAETQIDHRTDVYKRQCMVSGKTVLSIRHWKL